MDVTTEPGAVEIETDVEISVSVSVIVVAGTWTDVVRVSVIVLKRVVEEPGSVTT
jgi:hypothetical protein